MIEYASGESGSGNEANAEADTVTKAVHEAVRRLENYLEAQTDIRRQALSQSLERCPQDFSQAVIDLLVSLSKSSDDMISEKERNDATAATIILSLLAGAASDNAWDGMSRGAQIGGAIEGEVQQRAQKRLEQEIRHRYANLVDIAGKYGVDLVGSQNAL